MSKRLPLIVAGVMVLAAIALAYLLLRPGSYDTTYVTVRVIDEENAQPIHGARAAVRSNGEPVVEMTDADGNLAFAVPAGAKSVQLELTARGYRPWRKTLDRTAAIGLTDIALAAEPLAQSGAAKADLSIKSASPMTLRAIWEQDWRIISSPYIKTRDEMREVMFELVLKDAPALQQRRDRIIELARSAEVIDSSRDYALDVQIRREYESLRDAVRRKAVEAGASVN